MGIVSHARADELHFLTRTSDCPVDTLAIDKEGRVWVASAGTHAYM